MTPAIIAGLFAVLVAALGVADHGVRGRSRKEVIELAEIRTKVNPEDSVQIDKIIAWRVNRLSMTLERPRSWVTAMTLIIAMFLGGLACICIAAYYYRESSNDNHTRQAGSKQLGADFLKYQDQLKLTTTDHGSTFDASLKPAGELARDMLRFEAQDSDSIRTAELARNFTYLAITLIAASAFTYIWADSRRRTP